MTLPTILATPCVRCKAPGSDVDPMVSTPCRRLATSYTLLLTKKPSHCPILLCIRGKVAIYPLYYIFGIHIYIPIKGHTLLPIRNSLENIIRTPLEHLNIHVLHFIQMKLLLLPPPPQKKNAQKKLKNRCAIASKSLRKLVYPWPALSVCGQTGTHELKNDHPWEP